MSSPSPAHRRAVDAQLGFALAAVLFGIMAFAAKVASARIGGSQVALVRFSVGALPILLVPSSLGARRIGRWDLLVYRGLFGGLAVLLYFLAIEHVPVGLATLLNATSPVFAVLFAALLLGEGVRPVILLPAAGAFAGVMLVLRFRPGAASWHAAVGPWEVAGLASAVLAGAAVAAIRAARRSEGSWSIFASFTLFGVLCTLPLGVTRWVTPTVSEWVWLALVGLTSLAAQLLMTWAFRWVDNLQAGVIAQLSVVVSMALGVGFLDDRLAPLQALGALLTIASVVVVIALGAPAVPSPSGTRRGPEPRGREA